MRIALWVSCLALCAAPQLVADGDVDELVAKLRTRDHATASKALVHRGAAAVPALVAALGDIDAGFRGRAIGTLKDMGKEAEGAVGAFASALKDSDRTVRRLAASALLALGPRARVALPALIEATRTRDVDTRRIAVKSLLAVGGNCDEVVPPLTASLEDDDAGVREAAAALLAEMGERGMAALVAALEHADPRVPAVAVSALGSFGRVASGALPAIAKLLSHADPACRVAAAYTVSGLAEHAEAAREALVPVLGDRVGTVRLVAAGRLCDSPKHEPLALPVAIAGLRDPDFEVRHLAVGVLHRLHATIRVAPLIEAFADLPADERYVVAEILEHVGARALPDVKRALADPRLSVRVGCATTLSRKAALASEAIGELATALADADVEVRRLAVRAIRVAGAGGVPAIPALQRALADSDEEVRRDATRVLAELPKTATGSDDPTQALAAALGHADPKIREEALVGLARVRSRSPAVVRAVVAAVSDRDGAVRRRAVGVLWAWKALEGVPALIVALGDNEAGGDAVHALDAIGAAAMPALIAALEADAPGPKAGAATCLARLSSRAMKASPQATEVPGLTALIGALADPDRMVRITAAAGLGGMRTAATAAIPAMEAKALPALAKLLGDPDDGVRITAARSVQAFAEASVPVLIEALRSVLVSTRRCAIGACRDLSQQPDETYAPLLLALAGMLSDPDEEVRRAAGRALGSLGSRAVPAVLALLDDHSPAVHRHALEFLCARGPSATDAKPRLLAFQAACAKAAPGTPEAELGAIVARALAAIEPRGK